MLRYRSPAILIQCFIFARVADEIPRYYVQFNVKELGGRMDLILVFSRAPEGGANEPPATASHQ